MKIRFSTLLLLMPIVSLASPPAFVGPNHIDCQAQGEKIVCQLPEGPEGWRLDRPVVAAGTITATNVLNAVLPDGEAELQYWDKTHPDSDAFYLISNPGVFSLENTLKYNSNWHVNSEGNGYCYGSLQACQVFYAK